MNHLGPGGSAVHADHGNDGVQKKKVHFLMAGGRADVELIKEHEQGF